jgi:hypothetical protein
MRLFRWIKVKLITSIDSDFEFRIYVTQSYLSCNTIWMSHQMVPNILHPRLSMREKINFSFRMITTVLVSKLGILMQCYPIWTILLFLMMISGPLFKSGFRDPDMIATLSLSYFNVMTWSNVCAKIKRSPLELERHLLSKCWCQNVVHLGEQTRYRLL